MLETGEEPRKREAKRAKGKQETKREAFCAKKKYVRREETKDGSRGNDEQEEAQEMDLAMFHAVYA